MVGVYCVEVMNDVINDTVPFGLINYLSLSLPILVLQSPCGCTAGFIALLPLRDSRALLSCTIETGLETWTKIDCSGNEVVDQDMTQLCTRH